MGWRNAFNGRGGGCTGSRLSTASIMPPSRTDASCTLLLRRWLTSREVLVPHLPLARQITVTTAAGVKRPSNSRETDSSPAVPQSGSSIVKEHQP